MLADIKKHPLFHHNLVRRSVSALLLAPPVLAIVYLGGVVFGLLITVVSLLLLWEWMGLPKSPDDAASSKDQAAHGLVYAVALLILLLTLIGERVLALIPLAALAVVYAFSAPFAGRLRLWPFLGLCYIVLPMTALLAIRDLPQIGGLWVFWLLTVVWATDIGGYAVGKNIGGPKLAPRISPGKTWSGLAGAALCAAVAGGIFAWSVQGEALLMAAAGAVLAIIAQAGDLLESAAKRRYNKKDSSGLIPGHGGLLDRLDGVLAAALVLWLALLCYPDLICGLGGLRCL